MTAEIIALPVRIGPGEIRRLRAIEAAAVELVRRWDNGETDDEQVYALVSAVHGDSRPADLAVDAEVEDLRAGGRGRDDRLAQLMADWRSGGRGDAS